MAGSPNMDPRERAALDQFEATFRDQHAQFAAAIAKTSQQLASMVAAFGELARRCEGTAQMLAAEDGAAIAVHPDLAELNAELDGYYGD